MVTLHGPRLIIIGKAESFFTVNPHIRSCVRTVSVTVRFNLHREGIREETDTTNARRAGLVCLHSSALIRWVNSASRTLSATCPRPSCNIVRINCPFELGLRGKSRCANMRPLLEDGSSMVEQRPFKPLVGGSSPPRPTRTFL